MLVKWPQSDLASLRVVLRASFISKKNGEITAAAAYIVLWKFSCFRMESNSLKVALKLIEKTQTFFRICSRPQTMNTFLYLQKLSLTPVHPGSPLSWLYSILWWLEPIWVLLAFWRAIFELYMIFLLQPSTFFLNLDSSGHYLDWQLRCRFSKTALGHILFPSCRDSKQAW